MKKLSPIAYRALFFKHVWEFITKVTVPRELVGKHAIAVSGGADSMTLLWVAHELHKAGKIGEVRGIFINHHTREGQDLDGRVIQQFCEQEGIPFVHLHVNDLSPLEGNFEAKARLKRHELCLKELKGNELLWMGHHLDDSFEWNFMQRHRSTNPKSSIGIPVRNKKILRPFLSVTRAQINRLRKFEGIPFRDDPTNSDLRHDRNYIRHEIVPSIKKKYPLYLKFYSHQANFMAQTLKLSVINGRSTAKLYVFEEGAVLAGKHFSEFKIQELIHNYSYADRGDIVTSIERMLRAIANGKKGPFQFSGGMEAYYTSGLLMIYHQGMKNHDQSIATILDRLPKTSLMNLSAFSQIELQQSWENLLKSPDALMNMPGLVLLLESDSICKTFNASVFDPLFPKVSEFCKKNGLKFLTIRKCLDIWTQKKEKLPERLRLVPLFNLSNLFASQ